jgi:hypothetical protein
MASEAFFSVHQNAYLEMRGEEPPELAANQKFVALVMEIDIMEVSVVEHIQYPLRLMRISGPKSNCKPKLN